MGCSNSAVQYYSDIGANTINSNEVEIALRRSTTGRAWCCNRIYQKDGKHGPSRKIRQLGYDKKEKRGETDSAFSAKITINSQMTPKKIDVLTKLRRVNSTADVVRFPGTIPLSDAELQARIVKIPPAIEAGWNRRKYKIKITDRNCGERIFEVNFKVEFTIHPLEECHYEVEFVNVECPEEEKDDQDEGIHGSYVDTAARLAKWNIKDSRSVTNDFEEKSLEPHEYGHMIGLLDEYPNKKRNIGGCQYRFFNGTTERITFSDHLMGTTKFEWAFPDRYCLPVAYAVLAILTRDKLGITAMEIM